ncbi:hypothetical protein O0Q50_23230 [Priestia aryabhattai]|uniref:Uncharacterized protein n=1 Tax=Priestia aryabhattai TaxID=412384 RepID=A0AAX6NEL2_PRIAR|nr:hypothetical protein [Priestia aryabhattai]MDU9694100.1 hypothetical protein [Priestia aryabhattai]
MLYKLYQAYKITKEENVIEEKEVLILNYGGFGANLLHKPMHIVIEEIDDECKEEFNNDDIFDNNIDYGYVVTKIEHHRNTDQQLSLEILNTAKVLMEVKVEWIDNEDGSYSTLTLLSKYGDVIADVIIPNQEFIFKLDTEGSYNNCIDKKLSASA